MKQRNPHSLGILLLIALVAAILLTVMATPTQRRGLFGLPQPQSRTQIVDMGLDAGIGLRYLPRDSRWTIDYQELLDYGSSAIVEAAQAYALEHGLPIGRIRVVAVNREGFFENLPLNLEMRYQGPSIDGDQFDQLEEHLQGIFADHMRQRERRDVIAQNLEVLEITHVQFERDAIGDIRVIALEFRTAATAPESDQVSAWMSTEHVVEDEVVAVTLSAKAPSTPLAGRITRHLGSAAVDFDTVFTTQLTIEDDDRILRSDPFTLTADQERPPQEDE